MRRLRDRSRAQGPHGYRGRPGAHHAHRYGPARASLAHGAPGRVRHLRGKCRRLFHGTRAWRAAHRDATRAEVEISAMLSPELPLLFIAGDKCMVRLFPNYKEIELAYFRKTGIFPIMHVTTIKQEILEKFPWVPTNLTQAFEEAKQIA